MYPAMQVSITVFLVLEIDDLILAVLVRQPSVKSILSSINISHGADGAASIVILPPQLQQGPSADDDRSSATPDQRMFKLQSIWRWCRNSQVELTIYQ